MKWRSATAAAAGVVVLLLGLALTDRGLLDAQSVGDTGLYRQYGENVVDRGELPYRDFFIEFPPLAVPALAVPALAGDAYVRAFELQQTAFLAAALVLLVVSLRALGRTRREAALLTVLAAAAPGVLGPIAISSFDAWPALLATAALAALLTARTSLGFGLLAAGAAAKLYPLALLPAAIAFVRRSRTGPWRRGVAVFTAVGLVLVAPFAVLAPGGLAFSLEGQLRRDLQIESLGGSMLLVADRLGLYEARVVSGDPHSLDLAGALPDAITYAMSAVQVGVLVGIVVLLRRRVPSPQAFALAAATTVVGLVAFAKVLSPQFLVWLLPLVPLAAGAWGAAALTVYWAATAVTMVFFLRYVTPFDLDADVWVLMLRNALLVALFVVLARAARAGARTGRRGRGCAAAPPS